MTSTNLALATVVIKSSMNKPPSMLLVTQRQGRGEPSLLLDQAGPIRWAGEDGVVESLELPESLANEVMMVIRTSGIPVYETMEILIQGKNAQPLTLLKI